MSTGKKVFLLGGLLLAALACQRDIEPRTLELSGMTIRKAVGILYPTNGNDVTGLVTFMQTDSGIHVTAEIRGLTEGPHGIHIHEYGDCTASDGTSAGDHFNPFDMQHGAPSDTVRHTGDFGNIIAIADSVARMEVTDTVISFYGERSIIGRSVVIHAGQDDLKSQPAGSSGARIACGVIGIAE